MGRVGFIFIRERGGSTDEGVIAIGSVRSRGIHHQARSYESFDLLRKKNDRQVRQRL